MKVIEVEGTFIKDRMSRVSQYDHKTSFIDFELFRFRRGIDVLGFIPFFKILFKDGSFLKEEISSDNIFLCGNKLNLNSYIKLSSISSSDEYSSYLKVCLRFYFTRSITSHKFVSIEPTWEKIVTEPEDGIRVLNSRIFRLELDESIDASVLLEGWNEGS